MRFLRRFQLGCLGLPLLIVALDVWASDTAKTDQSSLQDSLSATVSNLHLGDAFYEYYQDHDLDALVRLIAYSKSGRISSQSEEAKLLEAEMWLELGFHQQATDSLEKLIASPAPESRKQLARLFLARMWYRRGNDIQAERQLNEIHESSSDAIKAERVHLLSNILIRQGRYAAAAELLKSWSGEGRWALYARFNLGVALLRDQQISAGVSFLDELGRLSSEYPDMIALRDRANVALGFALLGSGRSLDAQTYFRRVRLDGAYANRAMLGSGWADALQEKYQEALTPWLTLSEKKPLDTAVLEGLIAVPQAYEQLGALGQAAEFYENAVVILEQERATVREALQRKDMTTYLGLFLDKYADQDVDIWLEQVRNHPNEPESRYLYEIISGKDFQEGVKMYRETRYLAQEVQSWGMAFDANLKFLNSQANLDPSSESRIHLNQITADRHKELVNRIDEAKRTQLTYLANVIMRGLQAKQLSIESYLAQAHFHLAKLYDSSTLLPNVQAEKPK